MSTLFLTPQINAVLLIVSSIVFHTSHAIAAPETVGNPDAAIVSYVNGNNKGTTAGLAELHNINARGLAATPANVKLVRQALATRLPSEERATLISILGDLYDKKNSSGQNAAIKTDLRNLIQSGDRGAARAALFALSRTGNEEELRDLLQGAKIKGHIGEDEFAGELARNIRFLPLTRQAEYVAVLNKTGNKYGIDVLTSDLSNPIFLKQFSSEAIDEIDSMLLSKSPIFPFAVGEFGYFDSMRFSAWLRARALIYSQKGGRNSSEFILNELSDPKIDPRKIIGFLSMPEAKEFIDKTPHQRLSPILERVVNYGESFPLNRAIQDAIAEVLHKTR